MAVPEPHNRLAQMSDTLVGYADGNYLVIVRLEQVHLRNLDILANHPTSQMVE